jgi:osmotically-inducible protein OsmY
LAKKIEDKDIILAVERELQNEPGVPSHFIDVDSDEGVVTLTGTVATLPGKELASRIAQTIKGVRAVVNRIRVMTPSRPDEDIRKDVKKALLSDPATEAYEVDVAVNDGQVTLTGAVDSWQEKQLSEQVAKGVLGVKKVRPVSIPSDAEIEQRVKDALLRNPVVERYEIDVLVVNTKVHLHGTVNSVYEYGEAENVASRVKGVVEVKNNLKIDYLEQETEMSKSDREIKEDIKSELWWSPYVDSDQVRVEVRDGVATLTRTVDSWMERMAARDNGYDGGATRVRNYLAVKNAPTQ